MANSIPNAFRFMNVVLDVELLSWRRNTIILGEIYLAGTDGAKARCRRSNSTSHSYRPAAIIQATQVHDQITITYDDAHTYAAPFPKSKRKQTGVYQCHANEFTALFSLIFRESSRRSRCRLGTLRWIPSTSMARPPLRPPSRMDVGLVSLATVVASETSSR